VIDAVRRGGVNNIPLFTIYFNRVMRRVDRQTLRVRVDMPGVFQNQQGQFLFTGIYSLLGHEIYGDIIEVPALPGQPLTTPHTNEPSPFAAVFVPRPEYPLAGVQLLVPALTSTLGLEFPTVTVSLKGEFVFAPDAAGEFVQTGVLDAENIGGRVGRNEVRPGPIHGGRNPSGNLAQGGRFESWIFVRPSGDVINDSNVPPAAMTAVTHGGVPEAVPVNPNFASVDTLRSLRGVSAALANRIVASRGDTPFTGIADLRERARITDREWQALRNHLLLL
jgi:hypothetical protein